MLSIHHKANILRRAGYDVPAQPFPAETLHPAGASGRGVDGVYQTAQSWGKAIDALYAQYAAARAAQSLRDADEALRLAMGQCRPAKAPTAFGAAR